MLSPSTALVTRRFKFAAALPTSRSGKKSECYMVITTVSLLKPPDARPVLTDFNHDLIHFAQDCPCGEPRIDEDIGSSSISNQSSEEGGVDC